MVGPLTRPIGVVGCQRGIGSALTLKATSFRWDRRYAGPVTSAELPDYKLIVRLMVGDAIALGPGKADLLAAIAETGSISAAGRKLGMSYRRAWLLVDTMNQSFQAPLVIARKGGDKGGGAEISALGDEVLHRYQALMARAHAAIVPDLLAFQALLQPEGPAIGSGCRPLGQGQFE